MLSNFFGTSCTLDVALEHQPNRKTVVLNREKPGDRVYVYSDGEDVSGTAVVSLKPGKKLDHLGIKVELVGELSEFVYLIMFSTSTANYDLDSPGALYESKSYRWKFTAVDKTHETYWGAGVRLRYFVRLSVVRPYGSALSREVDFAVQNSEKQLVSGKSLKMEVGIEDCLHIEFEYDRDRYHLKDVVVGKVFFLLVRIKIKYMELDIVRAETVKCSNGHQDTETDTVTKFEIMDGAAVKSECIPVRLYLSGYELTPTYKDVQNRFSVKYFLNLVLVDEEERRYFKKQEVTLFRYTPE